MQSPETRTRPKSLAQLACNIQVLFPVGRRYTSSKIICTYFIPTVSVVKSNQMVISQLTYFCVLTISSHFEQVLQM